MNKEQVSALASRRIVNISFLEACMPIINDLSSRKKLPLGVRKPLNRINEQHYKVHGKLTLDDNSTYEIQNVLTKVITKEMNRLIDSIDEGGSIPLDRYLIIGIELANVSLKSIAKTDIRGLYSRQQRLEMLDFTPLLSSLNSFVNAGNKYLYKKEFVDDKKTYKVGEWANNIVNLYSDEVFNDIQRQSKEELNETE